MLARQAGVARIIAGELAGMRGRGKTFTPIHLWDPRLEGEQGAELTVPHDYTTALAVLRGRVRVNGAEAAETAEVVLFGARERICIDSASDTTALLLCGEPIDEPIVGQGPFVMNTPEEIRQAIADYQTGRMGHLR